MPIKAQFTDDYSSIVLSFDKESNTPAHGCHVFTNSTSKTFGSGARCTWTDPTTLTVFLGVGFTISPNDTVTIEKDNFREKAGVSGWNPLTMTVVQDAANGVLPVAKIYAPTHIGSCDNLTLDASQSTGAQGFLLNYSWVYMGSDTNLKTYASSINTSLLYIEPIQLPVGDNAFQLTVIDRFGKVSNVTSHYVTKSSVAVPVVYLPVLQRFDVDPTIDVIIRSQLKPPCESTKGSIRSVWSQVFSSDANKLEPTARTWATDFNSRVVPVAFPNSTHLFISNGTMYPGESYGFQIVYTSWDSQTGSFLGSANTTIMVTAKIIPVVASIAGGYERTITVPTSVSLDASASYDPHLFSVSYSWSVMEVSTSTVVDMRSITSTTSAALDLSSLSLNASTTYLAQVTVTGKTIQGAARHTKEKVYLTTTSNSGPDLSINVIFGPTHSQDKLNPNEKLSLKAIARADSFLWECTSHVSLDFSALNASGLLRSGPDSQLLVLSGGLTAGSTYKFQVTAISGTASATATYQVAINSPPSLGSCSVFPASGVSLSTEFTLKCQNWVDADLPLKYKFQEKARSGFSTTGFTSLWVDICEYREISKYETYLFSNPGDTYSTIDIKALISDSLGAVSSEFLSAVVSSGQDASAYNWERGEKYSQGDTEAYTIFFRAAMAYATTSSRTKELLRELLSFQSNEFDVEDMVHLPVEALMETLTADFTSVLASRPSLLALSTDGYVETVLDDSTRIIAVQRATSAVVSALRIPGTQSVDQDFIENAATLFGKLVAMGDSTRSVQNGFPVRSRDLLEHKNVTTALETLSSYFLESLQEGEDGIKFETDHIRFTSVVMNANSSSQEVKIPGSKAPLKMSDEFSPDSTSPLSIAIVEVPYRLYPYMPFGSWVQLGTTAVYVWQDRTQKTLRASNFSLNVPRRGVKNMSDSTVYETSAYNWATISHWTSGRVAVIEESSDGKDFTLKTDRTGIFSVFERPQGGNPIAKIGVFDWSQNKVAYTSFGVLIWLILFLLLLICCCIIIAGKGDADHFWRRLNAARLVRLVHQRSYPAWYVAADFGHRRRHTWMSIFRHPRGDYLTSVKRIFLLSSLLFISMYVCGLLMLAMAPGGNASLGTILGVAILGCVLALPLQYLMSMMYYREVPTPFRMRPVELDRIPNDGYKKWAGIYSGLWLSDIHFYQKEEDAKAMRSDFERINPGGYLGSVVQSKGYIQSISAPSIRSVRSRAQNGRQRVFAPGTSHQVSNGRRDGKVSNPMVITLNSHVAEDGESSFTQLSYRLGSNRSAFGKTTMLGAKVLVDNAKTAEVCLGNSQVLQALPRDTRIFKKSPCNLELSENGQNSQNSTGFEDKVSLFDAKSYLETLKDAKSHRHFWNAAMKANNVAYEFDERRRCCGLGPRHDTIDTQKWTSQDVLAAILTILFGLGALGGLLVISPVLNVLFVAWVISVLLCYFIDFSVRIWLVAVTEASLLRPCCGSGSAEYYGDPLPKGTKENSGARVVPIMQDEESRCYLKDTTVVFQSGNDVGFSFVNARVAAIEKQSQARDKGVVVGQKIVKVNGKPTNTDKEIDLYIHEAHRCRESFPIVFGNAIDSPRDNYSVNLEGEVDDKGAVNQAPIQSSNHRISITDIQRRHTTLARVQSIAYESGPTIRDIKRRHTHLGRVQMLAPEVVATVSNKLSPDSNDETSDSDDETSSSRSDSMGMLPINEWNGVGRANSEDFINVTYSVDAPIDFELKGVNVKSVQRLGLAFAAGVSPEMHVERVNGEKVKSMKEVREKIHECRKQHISCVIEFKNGEDGLDNNSDTNTSTESEDTMDRKVMQGGEAKLNIDKPGSHSIRTISRPNR